MSVLNEKLTFSSIGRDNYFAFIFLIFHRYTKNVQSEHKVFHEEIKFVNKIIL